MHVLWASLAFLGTCEEHCSASVRPASRSMLKVGHYRGSIFPKWIPPALVLGNRHNSFTAHRLAMEFGDRLAGSQGERIAERIGICQRRVTLRPTVWHTFAYCSPRVAGSILNVTHSQQTLGESRSPEAHRWALSHCSPVSYWIDGKRRGGWAYTRRTWNGVFPTY